LSKSGALLPFAYHPSVNVIEIEEEHKANLVFFVKYTDLILEGKEKVES